MSDTTRNAEQGNEEIIGLLQSAIDAETASRNLYWARSMYWRDKGFKPLARYYLEQSGEDHAERSAKRLLYLGGDLAIKPSPVEPFTDQSLEDQFKKDLEVETALSEFYSDSITKVSGEDPVTEDLFRKVLRSTQTHQKWLTAQLSQIGLMGEENYLATWI